MGTEDQLMTSVHKLREIISRKIFLLEAYLKDDRNIAMLCDELPRLNAEYEKTMTEAAKQWSNFESELELNKEKQDESSFYRE